jgi:L-2-hydroxyglutarate oxidase LhgO
VADIETIVVGAGVVGLATAHALALRGHEVLVLERHGLIGSETSARNSEVIHAGIYYPQGSLKAQFCVTGKELLYAYCASHGVTHKRLGKLIVATEESQLPALEKIQAAAARNGVNDLVPLSRAAARAMEPALECAAALHSPSTGIIDTHSLMLSLQGGLEEHGGTIALNADLVAARQRADGAFHLDVSGEDFSGFSLTCRNLVIAAGLHSSRVAETIFNGHAYAPPLTHFIKGNYFSLRGAAPFSRLIYPVPIPGGLGVHLTLDVAGQARFGPDVEPVKTLDYEVDQGRADQFYATIRRYWPSLADGALNADYAGIRPALTRHGGPPIDFAIHGKDQHGLAGLVCLYGIESPGLTSCLAIAGYVSELV